MAPLDRSAQVKSCPAETATAPDSPLTVVGVVTGAALAVPPTSPLWLSPQHITVPPEMTAQVWMLPAATDMAAAESPETATGTGELVVFPVPSSPSRLPPQQAIVPSVLIAQVWLPPAAIHLPATEMLTGLGVLVVLPLPIWPWELSPQHCVALPVSTQLVK